MDFKYKRLVNWICENGGDLDRDIFMDSKSPDNRTLKVAADKPANVILMCVPKKCTISGNLVECTTKLLKEMSLGEESFYHPFVDILPSMETLRKQLPFLQETTTEYVQKYKQIIQNEANVLYNALQGSDLPNSYKTGNIALYAVALYHSRAWHTWGFIPLFDLCQHTNNPQRRGSVKQVDDFYTFSSGAEFTSGMEIQWEYNTESNIYLYRVYGIDTLFPINYVKFNLAIKPTVYLYELKKSILEQFNYTGAEVKLIFNDVGFNDRNLQLLRLIFCTDREFLDGCLGMSELVVPFLNLRNERTAVKKLCDSLRAQQLTTDLNDKYVQKYNEICDKNITLLQKHWVGLLSDN